MANVLSQSDQGGAPPPEPPRDPLSIPSEVKASIRILVVDDERTLRESCASVLQMDGYNVTVIGRGEEAIETVKRRKFDIILVDLYMSQISGLEILQAALGAQKDTIVVVMTGNPSVTSSIEALRAGAWDYLPKPFSATHLQVLIGRASHAVMMAREAQDLRVQLMKQHGHSDKIALIGISPLFRKAVELARKVAATDASVFISGESGTGKEVIAQFIHQNSRRASRSLVPIKLPPLRKRPEDIPLLANHFLTHYWQRHRQLGDRVPRLGEAAIGFLRSRPWRGNVRELQNVIEHVAVLAEPDQVIQPNDIPVYDDAAEWPAESVVPAGVMDEAYHPAKDRVVAQFEKEYLTRLISRAGGNMSKAARLASIDRTTLYRLMDKHEFHRDDTAGSPE